MTEAAFATWQLAPGPVALPVVGDGATLRQVQVPARHVAGRHTHPHEQFLLVTAGGGVLQCAAGEVVLAPGVVVRLGAGAWHSAVFAEATVLVEVNLVETVAGAAV